MTAALGYAFLDKFGSAPIPRYTGDYRLMDKSVVEKVLALRETHVFLRGLVALVDQSPEFLEFDRPRRNTGRTKYNLWFGGIRSGLNGIVSYSTALLDWIIVTGLLLAVVSFFFGLKYFIYKISGFYIAPGNTQLFVMVTFIGGMQLVALGVLGLYVGRIFEEVKNRPRWFITETLAIDKKDFHDSARSGAM
jgi:dolichol-phosphate mannosyltransferase